MSDKIFSNPSVIPRLISCDEAGFNGNNLLNPAQPYFAYASHDLELNEADALLKEARGRFPVQMPELKSSKLLKSRQGRGLLEFVIERITGRYITTIYDKKLALAGKLFEYIYEPVLQDNNLLFYQNDLHRFVAMQIFALMSHTPMTQLTAEFEIFMRTLDPFLAPTLLTSTNGGPNVNRVLDQIRRFANGYNVTIARETKSLARTGATGKWVLDLTLSAVFSQLAAWGERHPVIEVICDDSKPLLALGGQFDVMIDRPDRSYVEFVGKKRPLTWNMSKGLSFAASATHAGIQVADLIAGATTAIPDAKPEMKRLSELLMPHLGGDCIMPDSQYIDLSDQRTLTNMLILEHLAQRADAGVDPLAGMVEVYASARSHAAAFSSQFAALKNPQKKS